MFVLKFFFNTSQYDLFFVCKFLFVCVSNIVINAKLEVGFYSRLNLVFCLSKGELTGFCFRRFLYLNCLILMIFQLVYNRCRIHMKLKVLYLLLGPWEFIKQIYITLYFKFSIKNVTIGCSNMEQS